MRAGRRAADRVRTRRGGCAGAVPAYHLEDSQALVLITWAGVLAEAVKGPEAAEVVAIFAVGPAAGSPGALPFERLLDGVAPPSEMVMRQVGDTALIVYTSGTTGQPKGAELTHLQLYMKADIPGRLFDVQPDDIVFAVLLLFHVFGLSSILDVCVRFGPPNPCQSGNPLGPGLGRQLHYLTEPSADSLNGPIGPRRRWAWTTADLADLKQIRAACGATINDVVLAAITRAFRDLLGERGELAERMVVRTMVPVSVRGPDEAGAVTNRVSAVLANLPVSEPDPLRRLALIQHEMDGLKHSHQAVSAEALTGQLGLAAPGWLALGTRTAFRSPQLLVQSVTTNVPGPLQPLYVLGRPLTALHPYVPIGNVVRISVAILSYVDTISFGVTADYDSSPDLDMFVAEIRRGLAELGEVVCRTGSTGPGS